jgi:hypothetical protein
MLTRIYDVAAGLWKTTGFTHWCRWTSSPWWAPNLRTPSWLWLPKKMKERAPHPSVDNLIGKEWRKGYAGQRVPSKEDWELDLMNDQIQLILKWVWAEVLPVSWVCAGEEGLLVTNWTAFSLHIAGFTYFFGSTGVWTWGLMLSRAVALPLELYTPPIVLGVFLFVCLFLL